MTRNRRGFTLVETMFAVALFSFAVAVVGPLLTRVAQQSTIVTGSQRRTASMVRSSSRVTAFPFAQLTAGCASDLDPTFPHTICTALVDTLSYLRRVQLVIRPIDTTLTPADTVILYRVDANRVNPFNIP